MSRRAAPPWTKTRNPNHCIDLAWRPPPINLILKSWILQLAVLLAAGTSTAQTVTATGPDPGTRLEDRVEIAWPEASSLAFFPENASFSIYRRRTSPPADPSPVLLAYAAATETVYDDATAEPNVTYEYCVYVRTATNVESVIDCDDGGRVINRPTGFSASDGYYDDEVLLEWSDRSEIEGGYNIYRDAGNALDLDGTDDYVAIPGTTVMPASFTVEFWSSRASNGTTDFIFNLQSVPQGNPTNVDLEIGFNSLNQFTVAFGGNILATAAAYTDSDWHHWAVTYDAASRRRTIYRDATQVATDVYTQNYTPSGNLEFGRREDGGNTNNRGYYGGKVDEIRIWDTILGQSQIESLIGTLITDTEPNLVSHWPMDVTSGSSVPDIVGAGTGSIINPNANAPDWSPTGIPGYYRQIGADLTSYLDRATVPNYQSYEYEIAAFEDIDGDGVYTPGMDFESERRDDTGWRAGLAPPGDVSATDGQFLDRVRVTWTDRATGETSYIVYRDAGMIATLPANTTEYDDFGATGMHEYCVAASNGVTSIQVCDGGMVGGLAPPADVVATNGDFDDRVVVSWSDTSDTEDGFRVLRIVAPADTVEIGTTDADAEEINDFTALQDVEYGYCVSAFSNADPANPSESVLTCTPGLEPGLRAAVLPPEEVEATDNDFEDRVEISWTNPSTTAMLFRVYKDNVLIDVLNSATTMTTDMHSPLGSGTEYEYCVSSETVVPENGVASDDPDVLQAEVSQIITRIRMDDAVRKQAGGSATPPEAVLTAVYDALGVSALGKTGATAGGVESGKVCDMGSRLLAAPTAVDATDDEFESHVEITWEDNSTVNLGYRIYRDGIQFVEIVGGERTTYEDHMGTPGVQFNYSVRAFDKMDVSAPDSNLGRRTLDPPTALHASDGTSETEVVLAWEDNSGAEEGYRIYRREVASPDSVPIGQTGTNESGFTDAVDSTDLGKDFEYIVTAFDDYGQSLRAIDEGHTALLAPADVNASEVYFDQVTIVWVDRSEVEDSYRLTRRPIGAKNIDLNVSRPAGTTMFVDLTAAAGTPYEYCVTTRLLSGMESEPVCDSGKRLEAELPPVVSQMASKINPINLSSIADGSVQFGAAVAMDDSSALIGAPGADSDFNIPPNSTGIVNLYSDFTNPPVLTATWGGDNVGIVDREDFGSSVDIDGDYAVVGDPFLHDNDHAKGGFSVWKLESGDWTEVIKQLEVDFDGDNTGISVAVRDSFVIVGNNLRDSFGVNGHGGAVVCNIEAALRNGTDCGRGEAGVVELDSVIAPGPQDAKAEFGYAVDIGFDTVGKLIAVVGAPGADKVYFFRCDLATLDCDVPADWSLIVERSSPYGKGRRFGASVAIDPFLGFLAVVGAPGAEGIAVYQSASFNEVGLFSPAKPAGGFGTSVAFSNPTSDQSPIIVGAPEEEIAGLKNAGAVYIVKWNDFALHFETDVVRYDARVAGDLPVTNRVFEDARFGASVALTPNQGLPGPEYYLVGAPGDVSLGPQGFGRYGAAYVIPDGLVPPDDPIFPSDISILAPSNVRASDGNPTDRIQILWDDESDGEDGYVILRSNTDGKFEEVGHVAANVESFDDLEAAPGDAYTYCVAPFYEESVGDQACDIGWLPPNGTIAGQLSARGGGGTEGARVCLDPDPNKALLFDRSGGYVEAPVGTEYNLPNGFTIEAWIRPHGVSGVQRIVSRPDDYAFGLVNGGLRFTTWGVMDYDFAPAEPLAAGTWYHVAAILDAGNDVTFYINGDSVTTVGGTVVAPDSVRSLFIGQSGYGTEFFNGEIDDVRFWNTERTTEEIHDAMSKPLKGDEENLLGYWPLDNGLRRIAPDVTELAGHGHLFDGVYLSEEGAPLDDCAVTTTEGNYSISRIRYGKSAQFNVIPSHPVRKFSPTFKNITLTAESPVQNEVGFSDVTALPVSGKVSYETELVSGDTSMCPVPNAVIHVEQNPGTGATDQNVKTTTGADGSYAVAVDPGFWTIIPTFVDPEDDQVVHEFDPVSVRPEVTERLSGVNFKDVTRHTLSGYVNGGDPSTCGMDIGDAKVRIYTQNGCFDDTLSVDTGAPNPMYPAKGNGYFQVDLPPQAYLMEVVSVDDAPPELAGEIDAFFERLGSVEVDLTTGDVQHDLIFRAPVTLSVEFPDELKNLCSGGITQSDEDGNVIRELPIVPVIGEREFAPLTIEVVEDYGGGNTCAVDQGTVTIFDGIADRADNDSTRAIENGHVTYSTFGASPNIIAGARVDGVDRSFQKPITVIANVEGVEPLTETRWALVEGFRARQSTFVSATTEEFPLLILRDPPGGNSSAFIEAGTTMCNRLTNTSITTLSGQASLDLKFGFDSEIVSPGLMVIIKTAAGQTLHFSAGSGASTEVLQPGFPNREICMSTSSRLETSSDPGWAGEDIHIGVALNLIFAIADVLELENSSGVCTIGLSETLAGDFDSSEPFATTYVYGRYHIEATLIPELENLLRLAGGDAGVEGNIDDKKTTIRLAEAIENWKRQLANNDSLEAEALKNPEMNRSFSGGTNFSYTSSVDTSTVTFFNSVKSFINASAGGGPTFTFKPIDAESAIDFTFEFNREWTDEREDTEERSKAIGYVLDEEDAGDYFSVDIARDPHYGTYVFGTKSGRSSAPCEAGTQCRDNPKILSVDPPVLFNVDPADGGTFEVSLANASESDERREYLLTAPPVTNPRNLSISAGGGAISGATKTFLIEPGRAVTVNMDVHPSPGTWAYKDVALLFYTQSDYEIWQGDPRGEPANADSAFFTVYFDSTGGNAMASPMNEGWTWFSINREGGDVNQMLSTVPAQEGDLLRSQTDESRYDTTAGWTGDLTTLVPGAGYRIRLQQPAVFRITGEAVGHVDPIKLEPGWNWVGYVPSKRLSTNDALASLSDRVREGDLVVGQRSFAQYVSGTGWVGTLDAMTPGESYAIYLSHGGELSYPTDVEEGVRPTVTAFERTANAPTWDIHPEAFDAAMTMVAEVQNKGVPLDRTTTRVAVFAGDSLRGVGDVQYVESLGRYLAFIMIYGVQAKEEEPLVVHVYDGAADELYEDVGKLTYEAQSVLGEPAAPVVLEVSEAGKAPELLDVPEEFALYQNYPNPFNPTTTIAYDLPEPSNVQIRVFDVLGRLVTTLVDSEKRAGRHKVVFDASQLASGFYVYRIKAGDFEGVEKMILVK